jgi:hypothetical protein
MNINDYINTKKVLDVTAGGPGSGRHPGVSVHPAPEHAHSYNIDYRKPQIDMNPGKSAKYEPAGFAVHKDGEHIGHVEKHVSRNMTQNGRLSDPTGSFKTSWSAHNAKGKEITDYSNRPGSRDKAVDWVVASKSWKG